MGQPPRIEAAGDLMRDLFASGPAIAPVEGSAGELPQLEVRLEHFHRTSHGDRQMLAHGIGHLMGLAIAQRISQFGMAGCRIRGARLPQDAVPDRRKCVRFLDLFQESRAPRVLRDS